MERRVAAAVPAPRVQQAVLFDFRAGNPESGSQKGSKLHLVGDTDQKSAAAKGAKSFV